MSKDFNVYKWRREQLNEVKYQTYQDYEKGKSKWGTPADLKEDIMILMKQIIRANPNVRITNIEDQSIEDKGIKFEIKFNSGDTIHAFKVDNWRGQWELYFNKKKSSEGDIKNYLKSQLEATSTPFENWKQTYDGFDTRYQYSDDPGVYRAGVAIQQKLNDLYDKLSPDDKAKADRYENR